MGPTDQQASYQTTRASYRNIIKFGDTCTQNCHLERYILGFMVGNLVLQQRARGAVKRNFSTKKNKKT